MADQPTPFLWFSNNAREAMDYYCSVFPNSSIDEVVTYPESSDDPHLNGMAGKVLSGWFTLNGQRFGCLDGGPLYAFNEAVSFVIRCQDQTEIDYYWKALSHVPESEQCGWCKDRFGLSWQIVPDNMGELLDSPQRQQAMMQMKKIVIADLVAAGS